MDKKEIKNRIEYIIICVSEFAKRFKLTNQQAYNYLRRFNGIDFLNEFYEVEHTQSIESAVDDLQIFCYHRGGRLS
ncbi:MAG: DUF3791 domain-containing protein [Muribaculaceae bacterium]|nr:DUF3791 domain-containing protein [Muribaculaceae bacterium]